MVRHWAEQARLPWRLAASLQALQGCNLLLLVTQMLPKSRMQDLDVLSTDRCRQCKHLGAGSHCCPGRDLSCGLPAG
jgi:hypothetical protein